MKVKNPVVIQKWGGPWKLILDLDGESIEPAKAMQSEGGFCEYEAKFEKWRDRRSTQANAYFHMLCTKIAKAQEKTPEQVKEEMIQKYGALIFGQDKKPIWIVIPKYVNEKLVYPYLLKEDENSKGLRKFFLFKHTADMDKEEMNHLIYGTAEEAAKAGVETISKEELTNLLKKWK